MIVVLKGGLGNQMFQYAAGISIASLREEPVFFTRDIPDSDPKRCYALGVFDIPIQFKARTTEPIYQENPYSFNFQVYTIPNGSCIDGQWQTEKYFNVPMVLSAFGPNRNMMSHESQAIADRIGSLDGHSAFIHVRRTDYIQGDNPLYHTALGRDYYQRGIELVRKADEHAEFFVFSDDPEWCRREFPDFTVVDCNKPGGRLFGSNNPGTEHQDIWLMSLCRHGIIANSSFSWWGAWLGDGQDDRTIVAPKQWFGPNFSSLDARDIVPYRWMQI